MHRVPLTLHALRTLIVAALATVLIATPFVETTAQTKTGKGAKTGKGPTTTKGTSAPKGPPSPKTAPAEKKSALPTVSKSDAKPVKVEKVDP